MEPDIKSVKNLHRPLQRDSEILVPLVARNLGFVHVQSLGQLSLRDTQSDARRNQEMPEPTQAVEIFKLAALEAFLAFYSSCN